MNRPAQAVAVFGALGLVAGLFLPWYGEASTTHSGWETLWTASPSGPPVMLGCVGSALLAGTGGGLGSAFPPLFRATWTVAGGAGALILTLLMVIDSPHEAAFDVSAGRFVSLAAAATVTAAGIAALCAGRGSESWPGDDFADTHPTSRPEGDRHPT